MYGINELTKLALAAGEDSYFQGGEAGYWRGFSDGAAANLNYIQNWDNTNPYELIPVRFTPMGHDYFPISYSQGH